MTAPIPEHIGPYKIEAHLAGGGMSILYLGIHPLTHEATAIKVLSPKYLSQPHVVERFLREAEIIALADHPNIIHLYGHGEWEGGLYIAMEYIEGVSLRNYLLLTPLSLKRALEIIIDVAYALCHLHTHGVVHGDLKPENILISENGAVKVIDFGIAQLLQEPRISPTEPLTLIGTPLYMSPEQRDNPHSMGYPSDIYSLGLIAYELVQGKPSMGQVQLSLLPRGLQKVLAKALQPLPSDRYRDVVDFITDISGYLHSGALEKEKIVGDYYSELAEELQSTYRLLLPPPPIWPDIESAIVVVKEKQVSAGFYEFSQSDDSRTFSLLAGIAQMTGPQKVRNILLTAIASGMAQALHAKEESSLGLFSSWNDLLRQELTPFYCGGAHLLFNAEIQTFSYLSYNYGVLLYLPRGAHTFTAIPAVPCPLGSDDLLISEPLVSSWNIGDTLVWCGLSPQGVDLSPMQPFWEGKWWLEPFCEDGDKPLQKRLEKAFRRAKGKNTELSHCGPLNLIAFYRRE